MRKAFGGLFVGVLAMTAVAMAGCSSAPAADQPKVAESAPAKKECVEVTGSMLCRKPGSGNVQNVSPEALQAQSTFRTGSSSPGGVK